MMMRTVAILSLAAALAGAATAHTHAAEPWTVDFAHTVVGDEITPRIESAAVRAN